MHIQAELISRDAFAPFGEVIAPSGGGQPANHGTAQRFDWTAQLASDRAAARANLAVFRSAPQPLPLAIDVLERHPHSTQTFLPMSCDRYLVIVAPAGEGGGPDLAKVRGFICGPGQGVNYKIGVWHHPIVAIGARAEFAMLVWEDGTAGDCVEHALDQRVTVNAR